MGEIFLARLEGMAGFEKIVVIKRVLPHLAAHDRYIAMLLDEARIAARLSHPNICQVYELGEVEGEYYIAMEYLEGVTLAELARRMGQAGQVMDPRAAVAVISQAAEGLHAAHELLDRGGRPTNLVHRDVSPANVFITTAGMVKVLDFGIAKTPDRLSKTRTGAVKGKWAYMSPEQILRGQLDRRSDLFSLGIVAFEVLTGRRLFQRTSEYETCRTITECDAPSIRVVRPELPEPLAQVIARALARDTGQRFATAREMGQALLDAATSFGGPAGLPHIAELVTTHFAKELNERRSFIERVDAETSEHSADHAVLPVAPGMTPDVGPDDETSSVPPPPSRKPTDVAPPLRALPSNERPASDVERADTELAPAVTARSGSERDSAALAVAPAGLDPAQIPTVVGAGRRWLRWTGAGLVLALIGGGLYLMLMGPRLPSSERQARVETERGQVLAISADAGPSEAASAAVPDAGAEPAATDPDPDDRGSRPRERRSSNRPGRAGDRFQRALARRQRALTGCYSEHTRDMPTVPLLQVVMQVDADGAVSKARLLPRGHDDTPLGRCLLGIVRSVDFGRMDQAAEVTIPLGVRVKR